MTDKNKGTAMESLNPGIDDIPYPTCIFHTRTRDILSQNQPFTELFPDHTKTVDTLFWQTPDKYDSFIHRLETDGALTRYETTLQTDNIQTDLLLTAKPLTAGAVLMTVADITKWKRKEQITSIQRDLGLSLASCDSLEAALKHCFTAAIAVSGMECGGIYLTEKKSGDFVLRYWENVSKAFVTASFRSSHDAQNIRLIQGGEPLYTNYEEINQSLNTVARNEGIHAIGLIPITNQGKVIGSFNIASRTVDAIPRYARDELELIASQVGNAITNFQAEEEIKTSRHDMKEFFDTIQDFIFVLSADGGIIRTNTAVSERLGYTEQELLRMNVLEIHPPERRDEAQAIVADMIAGTRDFCPIPLLAKNGTEVPVETKVTPGHWSGEEVLFGLSRDISEREKAKELLEKRDEILNAVSITAHTFLNSDRWDDRIDTVLKQLGMATGVDRVYIFQNATDTDGILRCSQRFEWCAPGVEPQIDNPDLQNVNFVEAGFPRWIQVMADGNAVAGDINSFPKAEHDLLDSQGIKSLVVVPIISDARWWGYIGFDECKIEREWSPSEVDALRVAADILGSAIYKTMVEEVFKKPVEKSLVGTYLIYNGTLEYINPRFAEISGYRIDELIHIKNMEDIFHPDDRALFHEQVRKRLSGEVESVHYEFRGITKTQETIYLEAYGSTIEYRGEPAIVGNIMDITDRKLYETELRESLDEKVVLLNEIHHRVKNNLQIISAFIRLQMMCMEDSAGLRNLKKCDNQVLTMALIHESLYKADDFTHIPLHDHVINLVTNLTDSYNGSAHYQCTTDVEDIILPLDTIIPCSLTITEFINISQKKESEGEGKQMLEIAIHRMPNSSISMTLKNRNLHLTDEEDNCSSDSMEIEMIHSLVTKQLKGTIEMKTDVGTELNIAFPEK